MKLTVCIKGRLQVNCWEQNFYWTIWADFVMLGIQKRMEARSLTLRASKKSSAKSRKLKQWLFLTTSSGFLQGRRNIYQKSYRCTVTRSRVPLVWYDFLYLPVLLEGPELLQCRVPQGCKAQGTSRGAKEISWDKKGKDSSLWVWKSPSDGIDQKK